MRLAAAPRGLIPLRRGGCVVLFRHTKQSVVGRRRRRRGAERLCWRGFWTLGLPRRRAAERAQVSYEATAGLCRLAARSPDGLCLVSHCPARRRSGSRTFHRHRSCDRSLPPRRVAWCVALRFTESFSGGVAVTMGYCAILKYRETPRRSARRRRGSTEVSEGAASLQLTAADAVVALGSLTDATFGARTAHRWPFQPQREGDARKAARAKREAPDVLN